MKIAFRLLAASALFALVACGGSNPAGPAPVPTPTPLPAALWSRTGSGDMVFDMPSYVARVRIQAAYGGNSSNFIVWIGTAAQPESRLLVNELLGTAWGRTSYDGVVLTGGGGVTSVSHSSGVSWAFTEVR